MAKRTFWKSDWFLGLLVSFAFIFSLGSDWLAGIERWAYDFGVRSTEREPAKNIAVIAIDDQSIANIGRWPWPRDLHAQILGELKNVGAKVIGPSILFSEAQQDTGVQYLQAIQEMFKQSTLSGKFTEDSAELKSLMSELNRGAAALPDDKKTGPIRQQLVDLLGFYFKSSLVKKAAEDANQLGLALQEADTTLDQDAMLATSINESGNIVLPMVFDLGFPQGNPDKPLPDFVQKHALINLVDNINASAEGLLPIPAIAAFPPIDQLGSAATGIAHLNQTLDVDGGIRTEPLVIDFFGEFYPSFALMLAAKSLNLSPEDIQVELGEGIKLKNLKIGTDVSLQMRTFFYQDKVDGSPAFTVDSFFDVATGKIPFSKYKNKIVLIGPTAAGISTPQKTPVDEAMHPVLTVAHSVSSILNEDFFVEPEWTVWVRLISMLVIIIYLIVLLPKVKASLAAILTFLFGVGLFVTEYILMTAQTTWVPLMTPLVLLVVGHMLLTTKRFLWTEQAKEVVEADSSETNRMLGIAFQGQGQLDQAFEKFRKCTMDDVVMDNLYNLALDYERKRQFNKAGSVYRVMAEYDSKFRDIESRLQRAEKMESTMVIGGGGSVPTSATMFLDGDEIEKPMLGRYQVEKELGKGAMGMVYLGRDPKINRVVAIKTMALSQEFDESELADVTARFFREAESAGRLNHPNIVTIYDAGEEHDLAYIAMELLKGDDLSPYINPDSLLPVPKVMSIMAKVADALNYAHSQNVVHRDIKPANVMYEPDEGIVKVADFGIARVTDSSKTKTGMVLGTPSYMSPEQLSGKHVDGRSDLFSFGVMMYQMLTGELPFSGDSLATLMYKIANDEAPDITGYVPDLPPCLVAIINKCMVKSVDERFQTGAEIRDALVDCASTMVKT
ncbi:MAG: CHASE2 domain-containing protein [Gammaproteobacteria bacterium]|nr:MAG: CHASE2 domain-containing protein [Gammaproteobacteria bacterium]